jgi:HPt (histidine-containing phosphotransfer) domain-containing protein
MQRNSQVKTNYLEEQTMNNPQQTLQPAWNATELLSRIDNDQELLLDLVAIFNDDFPRIMGSLQSAIAEGSKNVASISHTLKGMLANLGGTRAAAVAAKLESLANSGDKTSLQSVFSELEREGSRVASEIQAYMAEVRS